MLQNGKVYFQFCRLRNIIGARYYNSNRHNKAANTARLILTVYSNV